MSEVNADKDCPTVSIYPWLYETNISIEEILPPKLLPRLIHHWRCFPVPNKTFFLVIGIIYLIIGVLALICNITVIYICAKRTFRNLTDILTINLFIADLLMVVCEVPLLVLNCFKYTWFINSAATCSFHAFSGGLLGTTSIVTITVIAIDRFFAIVPPYNVRKFTKGTATGWLIFIWLYSILWNLPPIFNWNSFVLEGGVVSCSFNYLTQDKVDRAYILSMFFAVYCFPLTIILFSYLTIMFTIYRLRKQFMEIRMMREDNNSGNTNRTSRKKRSNLTELRNEYRIFKIFLNGVLLWLVAWTPYAVVALTGYFGDKEARSFLTPVMTMLPAIFAKLAACYNPILFALKNPNVRFELSKKYERWKKRCYQQSCARSSTYKSEQTADHEEDTFLRNGVELDLARDKGTEEAEIELVKNNVHIKNGG